MRILTRSLTLIGGTTLLCLAGCGGGASGGLLGQLGASGGGSGTITITAALAGGIVNQAYSATLTSTGGTAPVIWSVTSGSLPTGIQLDGMGIAGTMSGTPTTEGSYTFTLKVTDSAQQFGTKQFTIVIAAAGGGGGGGSTGSLTILPSILPSGTVGVAYTQTLSATGGTAPYGFMSISGTLPPGVGDMFAMLQGDFSGTPTTAGTYTFTLKCVDNTPVTPLEGTQAYTVVIASAGGGGGGGGGGTSGGSGTSTELIVGTDPWYISVDADNDGDGTADFDEALVDAGLNAQRGATIDDIVSDLWESYGNNPDSSLSTTGFKISFTAIRPSNLTEYPGSGAADNTHYNVCSVPDKGSFGSPRGLVPGWGDNNDMDNLDWANSGQSPTNFYGVFARAVAQSGFSGSNFAAAMGHATAHEIGHMVGLHHDDNSITPHYIMYYSLEYNMVKEFSPGAKDLLGGTGGNAGFLPGPGR